MRNIRQRLTLAVLITGIALLASPLAYSQIPDEDPATNEGVCDELMADGTTKGLYGLCVAFCEAQDCEATVDAGTGEVVFAASCRASNPKHLDNYNKRKTAADPHMPCVNVTTGECPCWTELELDMVADGQTNFCFTSVFQAHLNGLDIDQPTSELADSIASSNIGQCTLRSVTATGVTMQRMIVTSESESMICHDSIAAECASRGF